MSKKIGVFSGVFDPIHIGHVEACLVALAACELQQVIVLIEQKPRRKDTIADYTDRKKMVELALGDFASINLFDTKQANITYAQTVPKIKKQFPHAELCYIVGSDTLMHLGEWEDIGSLLQTMELCVVLRDNKDKSSVERELASLKKQHPKLVYKVLPAVWSPITSSAVREQLASSGHSDLVHRNVLSYIQEHKLYKTT